MCSVLLDHKALNRPLWGLPAFLPAPFPDSVSSFSSYLPKESEVSLLPWECVINIGRIGGRVLGPIFGCGLILECALRSSDTPLSGCVRRKEE